LDEVTRNIYKENVQLTESLKLNINENDNIKKVNKLLYEDNSNFKAELELNKMIVHEKVDLTTKQNKQIKDVGLFYLKHFFKLVLILLFFVFV
jgi:hypothetical protein